jgi:cellulase/cellobiase CelA1
MRRSSASRGLVVLALLTLAATAACSPAAPVPSAATLPPPTAAPEVVLDAYLRALVAGDCDTGRKLATATFAKGNGELCGDTHVSAYQINPVPARPNAGEVVFSTTVTTTGTADGSILPGAMTWFYSLDQQPDGSWRLVGGGSGP